MLGYSFERIVLLLLLGVLFLGVVYLVASVLIHRYSGDRWPTRVIAKARASASWFRLPPGFCAFTMAPEVVARIRVGEAA